MWLDHSRGRATPKDGKVALWQLTLARDSVPDWPQWKLETRESMRRSPTSRGSNLPLVCQVQHPWLGARYWAPCCDLSSIVVDLKHSVITNQNQSHFCFKNSINQPASLQRDQRAETKEMFIQNISFLNLLKKLWSNDNCEVVRTSAVNQPFEISTFISKRLIVCSGEKIMCNLSYEKCFFLKHCSKKSLPSPPNSRYHTQIA